MKISVIISIILFTCNLSYTQWVQTNGPGYTHSLAGNGTILFAAADEGVFKTTNNGNNWINTGAPSGSMLSIAINGSDVYAGTSFGNLYKSTDLGNSWVTLNLNDHNLKINTVNFIRVFNNKVFVGKSASFPNVTILFASTDGGLTWFNSGSGLPDFNAYCMVERGTDLFVAAGGPLNAAIYHSSTGGSYWTYVGLSYGIAYMSLSNQYFYAGSYTPGGIFRSPDNGLNWNTVTLNGLPNSVSSLVNDDVDNLYAGVYDGGMYFLVNNGNNWVNKSEGLYGTSIPNSLYIMNPYIYIGMSDHHVYKRILSEITSVNNNRNDVPSGYSLYQNYPNPFNPTTKLSYDLPSAVNVELVVYDMLGRVVKTLVNEKQNAGNHEIEFDASNYPSGVYYYKLSTDNFSQTKKMVLIK